MATNSQMKISLPLLCLLVLNPLLAFAPWVTVTSGINFDPPGISFLLPTVGIAVFVGVIVFVCEQSRDSAWSTFRTNPRVTAAAIAVAAVVNLIICAHFDAAWMNRVFDRSAVQTDVVAVRAAKRFYDKHEGCELIVQKVSDLTEEKIRIRRPCDRAWQPDRRLTLQVHPGALGQPWLVAMQTN